MMSEDDSWAELAAIISIEHRQKLREGGDEYLNSSDHVLYVFVLGESAYHLEWAHKLVDISHTSIQLWLLATIVREDVLFFLEEDAALETSNELTVKFEVGLDGCDG